jgi:alcohol dehydrogenase
VTAFPEVLTNPADVEARGRMLFGASLAGLAIENSMLGAAHAAANPLTAHFNIVHGQAVGMMLPAIIRFNGMLPEVRRSYGELVGLSQNGFATEVEDGSGALAAGVEALLDLAALPRTLRDCGVTRESIPMLASEAAKQWTASFNPRPVSEEDFVGLYQQVL